MRKFAPLRNRSASRRSSALHKQEFLRAPIGEVCPLKAQNSIEGESITVLIHLPNGGFNCVALPFEAVEEVEKE
jgi:hypothetical protein